MFSTKVSSKILDLFRDIHAEEIRQAKTTSTLKLNTNDDKNKDESKLTCSLSLDITNVTNIEGKVRFSSRRDIVKENNMMITKTFKDQELSIADNASSILLTESYSSDPTSAENMPTNPFKKLHQSLLAKEKNRKDGIKRCVNKMKFWKKKDKNEKDDLVEEDNASTISR